MPYLMVISAAVCWGIIGIFSKALVSFGFSSTQIVFVRAFGAVVVLGLGLLLRAPRQLAIQPKDSIYFVGTGIVSFVFFNWCYFTAISYTSLSVAAVLMYTSPAIVSVLSVLLFGERMNRTKLMALGMTFAGCVLVAGISQGAGYEVSLTGILAGLGSGLGYALYSIFGRYALNRYSPMTVTFYTFVFASLGLVPITDLAGLAQRFASGEAVLYGAGLCLISTVLPFALYTKGLAGMETGRAAVMATLEPVVATVVGIVLFSEPLTVFKAAGVLLVLFAVYQLTHSPQTIKNAS